MDSKTYKCGYKHCLHKDELVDKSSSIKIATKYYHWDCATIKQEIDECVQLYIECIGDATQYPLAMRIVNSLVFSSKIPTEFILKNIKNSHNYYASKPPFILYGLRKLYWEVKREK